MMLVSIRDVENKMPELIALLENKKEDVIYVTDGKRPLAQITLPNREEEWDW